MLQSDQVDALVVQGRTIEIASTGDNALGPLKLLPGLWKNVAPTTFGRGWNMIALPFSTAPTSPFDYRLLVNQFNEELFFSLVDKAVPNRGVRKHPAEATTNTDQFVVTLDYEQTIKQIAAADEPVSGLAGPADAAIHHEPGLFLHLTNQIEPGDPDVARLGSVPHGNAVLALGSSVVVNGPPVIPAVDGLPIGVPGSLETSAYLAPYKHFHDNPFLGVVPAPFPGFDPTEPHKLLDPAGIPGVITRTTVLDLSTSTATGGIDNIPFVVAQAEATEMRSIFWIIESDVDGIPEMFLSYLQIVMLDFFTAPGSNRLIRWPHVSINTMQKVKQPEGEPTYVAFT